MQVTGNITPGSLMTLEAYSKWRKEHKAEIIAHRKLRSVRLGENITLQFESETTMRYQIQEMLRQRTRAPKTAIRRGCVVLPSASGTTRKPSARAFFRHGTTAPNRHLSAAPARL